MKKSQLALPNDTERLLVQQTCPDAPLNDAALRGPSKKVHRAGTRAKGARQQAKRDGR